MRKEKFVYNTQTLRYEKLEVPLKTRILRAISFICAILVFAAIISSFALAYLPSPKEQMLQRELNQMKTQYKLLGEQMALQDKVLANLRDRDASVYRMIFGMDPIANDVRNMGIGGSDKYAHLTQYKNTGEVMVETSSKLDKIGRQMATQSKSLDEIIELAKDREKMFASIPSIKPVKEDKLNKSMRLMSGFGRRLHPIHKVIKMHQGIDFSAPIGTPIQVTGDGKVTLVKHKRRGYGKYVVVDHGYGYKTLYAHMSAIDVRVGQKVKKGQMIGKIGNTGTSTAPHLHYEVRYKGKPINPIHFCMDGLSPQEYQALVDASAQANQSFD